MADAAFGACSDAAEREGRPQSDAISHALLHATRHVSPTLPSGFLRQPHPLVSGYVGVQPRWNATMASAHAVVVRHRKELGLLFSPRIHVSVLDLSHSALFLTIEPYRCRILAYTVHLEAAHLDCSWISK